MYKTFIQFNDVVKREGQNIPLVFGFVFKPPNYYIPDSKLEKTLEKILDQKRQGGAHDQEDFNFGGQDHVVQDYDDNRHQFDKDDEDSGDDDMDILADVRKAEEFATNQSHVS